MSNEIWACFTNNERVYHPDPSMTNGVKDAVSERCCQETWGTLKTMANHVKRCTDASDDDQCTQINRPQN